MRDVNAARIQLVPAQADLAAAVAAAVLAQHASRLPDLTHVTLLVPATAAVASLRRALLRQAGRGLLGPHIQTLASFARARGPAVAQIPSAECRLILVEALRRFKSLFPGLDPWQLAESLFGLFEELSLNAVALPDDAGAFTSWLARAYGGGPLAALSREAQIVHVLWRAFLEETAAASPSAAYVRSLRGAFASLRADEAVYAVGFDSLAEGERSALGEANAGRFEIWLHGRTQGRDGAATAAFCARLGADVDGPETEIPAVFLDYALGTDLSNGEEPSAALAPPPLRITVASDPEHEARCVDLAVREALLAGCHDVAVVTEDRRLARRLRALLERADVELLDHAGWALSTSAAAAALNSWLDAIERRFQFRPLLDFLKSGFCEADALALQVLERELVFGKGIESGLERYRAEAAGHPVLADLLDRLAQAARLMPAQSRIRPARDWIVGIQRSLEALGLWKRFGEDAAGQCLLEVLQELDSALARRPQSAEWTDFRALLDRALERANFVPPAAAKQRTQVRLLTLEQGALTRCDALVLAGATREQIPGFAPAEPFFNQAVRAELGLSDFGQRHSLALARLRRVLEAAPRIHITYAGEKAGEPAQLCPWIEAIEARASALGHSLRDATLARRAGTQGVEISQPAAPAATRRVRPSPPAPVNALPDKLSATTHQALIDCPYRFFAGACLGLRAEEAPDEDPDRSDFGRRVHRILQAFTQQVPGLPPPFRQQVTAANRPEAQARLQQITAAVLEPDLQGRILAHVWLNEFEGVIPALLDWLEQRQTAQVAAEVRYERSFGEHFSLIGNADRVETLADGGLVIVDYKTGRPPSKADVDAGEAVQLAHYAMLDDRVAAVEYLPLRDDQKALKIEGSLESLRAAVGSRLHHLLSALEHGAPMPAQGDAGTCSRCDYAGLCRKGDWHE